MISTAWLFFAGRPVDRLRAAEKIINEILKTPGAPKKGHPDLLVVKGETSLGIAQVRRLQQWLARKPYQAKGKIVLIPEAGRLSLPAQNALLKTLEEPPPSTQIILLAKLKESLLPTVLSRCRLVPLKSVPQINVNLKNLNEAKKLLKQVLKLKRGERLNLTQGYQSRESAEKLTAGLLVIWRTALLDKIQKKDAEKPFSAFSLKQILKSLKKTQKVLAKIEANVNPRLALDHLFWAYPDCP